MNISKITKIQLQIIVNRNLYQKNIIDENMFSKVNDKLLKALKVLEII